jgi:predicted unusual protein kinase regulating ubiquinone biosynthesis (AarF/ABC1/UbiB family)
MSKKEQKRIPVGKVKRATKYLSTGVKVGGNYVNHLTKKVLTGDADETTLHQRNAQEIFDAISELKGGPLKVAQMLSLDTNALPAEYLSKFAEAQYQTPALSYPLVVKTFRKSLGKEPLEIFDTFSKTAVNAASMGQVHRASTNQFELAVKVQYPGVAQSVKSDLKVVSMIAKRFSRLNTAEIDHYMEEVEERLMEETDYHHELQQSMELSSHCQHLPNLRFPKYFTQWSSNTILTMEWIEGKHLTEYLAQNPSPETRNQLGQALWDFYQYQIHHLKKLHADPHPGNFIFGEDQTVAVIDFGCTKVLPNDFYSSYFQLLDPNSFRVSQNRDQLFEELGFIYPEDSKKEREFFTEMITATIELLGKPFFKSKFDFGDSRYFSQIHQMGEKLSKASELRYSKRSRGSRHALYLNRTYFGLYNLLHQLGATVETQRYLPENGVKSIAC